MTATVDKFIIANPLHDRRVKLTQEQRKEIISKGAGYGIRKMAREYGVDRRLIGFVLYPERVKRVVMLHDWKRYYTTEKNTAYMKRHRYHKK